MARPKKLSGNDKFMLSKLRGDGLILLNGDLSDIPIEIHWNEWRGIKLSGESCNIDKNYRLPNKDKIPNTPMRGRPKGTSGFRLGNMGFGNTNDKTKLILERSNNNSRKFIIWMAICNRLLEYDESGTKSLTHAIEKLYIGDPSNKLIPEDVSTLWDLWKYRDVAKQTKINDKYEQLLEDIGLPKPKK